jgi:poly(3-hydroxybutyrate) depolymerase
MESEDVYGTYYVYVPKVVPEEPGVLVLVHGTPQKGETAEFTAHYYIANWVDFAEDQGLILIVPAFNQEDFSSRLGDHAISGYRGLFGREIGADEWVLRLVEAYQSEYGVSGTPFYLYGHSAGGQYVARFLVTHPERVKRAVLSAAATYPQTTTQVVWPYGMGELHAEIVWDAETTRQVDIVPDKDKWLAATQVPLTVIVGLNDIVEVPYYPGQQGANRLIRARNWVGDMGALAAENGLKSHFEIEMIPGKGHSMYGLIPYVQGALIPR